MKPHILIFAGTAPKNLKSARYIAKNVEPIGRLDKVGNVFVNGKDIIGMPTWGLYKSDMSMVLFREFDNNVKEMSKGYILRIELNVSDL